MKAISKLFFTGVTLMGLSLGKANAQGDVAAVMSAGIDDANKVLNAYFEPFAESFGMGLAQNWFNTASPLKLLRFNVQLGASFIPIPDEKKMFEIAPLGLANLRPVDPTVTMAPTLHGDGDGPVWAIYGRNPANNQEVKIQEIAGLTSGAGLAANAAPFVQFNLGLIKKTEVSIRFVPTLDFSTLGSDIGGSAGLWGVGVKHDLMQWIPFMGKLPFSLSGYFNYTALNVELNTSVPAPTAANYAGNTGPGAVTGFRLDNPGNYDNQKLALNANAMGFGVILSKKLLMFTPYVSAGFLRSSFSLKTAGDYAIQTGLEENTATADPTDLREIYTNYNDPINIEFNSANTMRVGAGLRVKLLIFGLHGEIFNAGGYTGYNLGLSLGF